MQEGEVDGRDHYFKNKYDFEKEFQNNGFWECYDENNNYYGI